MKPQNRQYGFSLLEVLIAFAILALSIGILLKIFSGGANTALLAEEYTTAVQIAESLMAKEGVETPLQIGEITGIEDEKYSWWVTVSPYQFNPGEIDVATLTTQLLKVDVLVSWGQEGRELHLSTLKVFTNSIADTTGNGPTNESDLGN